MPVIWFEIEKRPKVGRTGYCLLVKILIRLFLQTNYASYPTEIFGLS